MTFCRNCGAAVEGQFCPQCGQPVPAASAPPAPPTPPAAAPPPPAQSGGFFADLFDFSFSRFITARIIKVLYILAILGLGLMCLMMFVAGITQGGTSALGAIIGAPLLFFLGLLYVRVLLEVLIVIFRIAENTAEMARRSRP